MNIQNTQSGISELEEMLFFHFLVLAFGALVGSNTIVSFGGYNQESVPSFINLPRLPANEQWTQFSSCIRFK